MKSTTQPLDLPRRPLAFLPTPLIELPRLAAHLDGPRIFMKRDDLTGLAFGGNKTRKLEYLLGDALAAGADTLITGGAAQSNHCRQTAAAAAAWGLDCHLVLGGEAPEVPGGNLLLDQLLGAELHWCGELRKGERIPEISAWLAAQGRYPYAIPYGGSNAIGAAGFVEAARELVRQLEGLDLSLTHVVFPTSSGGTHAGLLVGRSLIRADWQLVGVQIDKDQGGDAPYDQQVLELACETAALVDAPMVIDERDLGLETGYLEAGYGVVGELEREAVMCTAQLEGILLDPVYTGRAMGALMDLVRSGRFQPEDRVLFWHTGGAPGIFAYGEALLAEEETPAG